MSDIPPIGPGGGGGFDPNRRKTPEERKAEAERLKEERAKKRGEIAAKENVEKNTEETREKAKEYWTDDDGQDHVDVVG